MRVKTTTTTELRTRAAAAEGRKLELAAEREELAFQALIAGDAKARKRLDDIETELHRLDHELATIGAALAEAGRRAEAATAEERAAAERKRAAEAEPIARRLEARGQAMDRALMTYVTHFKAIQSDLDELQALGVPVPSRTLVEVNSHRAHDTALASLGDKFIRPVPPLQRHSFDKLLRGWAGPALAWISSRVNTNTAAEAA
jgi:hypothetical protein